MTEAAIVQISLFVLGGMLAIIGVLLLRILKSLDATTGAVSDLNITVGKLGVQLTEHSKRVDLLEREFERRLTLSENAIELVRARTHGIVNEMSSKLMRFELFMKTSGMKPAETNTEL